MSLVKLTRPQMETVLRVATGGEFKLSQKLELDVESQLESLRVLSLFGLPDFQKIYLTNVSDFDKVSGLLARLLSVAGSKKSGASISITGDAYPIASNKNTI